MRPSDTIVPLLVVAKDNERLRAGDLITLRVRIMSEFDDGVERLVAAIGPHFIDVKDFIESPTVVSHDPQFRIGDLVTRSNGRGGKLVVRAMMNEAGDVFTGKAGEEMMCDFSYLCCAYLHDDNTMGSPEILRTREASIVWTYQQQQKVISLDV